MSLRLKIVDRGKNVYWMMEDVRKIFALRASRRVSLRASKSSRIRGTFFGVTSARLSRGTQETFSYWYASFISLDAIGLSGTAR